MTVQLYLIRHGETEWSQSGRHTGRTDIDLTPHGEQQAAALQPFLAQTEFSHVLVSPRLRARRTCELAGLGAREAAEADLQEWDYGDDEGRTAAEIQAITPGWTAFANGFPNGESFHAVSHRADRLLARVARLSGNVALFSHGHFSCILAVRWLGLTMHDARHFTLGTASVSILGHNPSHPELRVITLWNALPGPGVCGHR